MELVAEKLLTVEEYFEFEENSEERHEFVNGTLIEMPGESTPANEICINFVALLKPLLKGKPFKLYTQAVKLMTKKAKKYRYPDVMVVQSDGVHKNYTENPMLIVEVLSEGTEKTDRSIKLKEYTEKQTLQYYFLVSQEKMQVEVYSRNQDNWEWTLYEKVEDIVLLPFFEAQISLADIYEEVSFETSDKS